MDNLSGWHRYAGYDPVSCLDWMLLGSYIFRSENRRYK